MPASTRKAFTVGCATVFVAASIAALGSLAIGATDVATMLFVIAFIELLGVAALLTFGRFARRIQRAA
jgi:hypothetical protein